MSVNIDQVIRIINNNESENVIFRTLELRSTELAKYMCGLNNKAGGYILLGVEKQNGHIEKIGCLKNFDVESVIEKAKTEVSGELFINYCYISVDQTDVFVVEVANGEQSLLVDGKYYEYVDNNVQEKVNQTVTLFISYTNCDTPIVDIIEEKIKSILKDKIKISRFTELQYKDSFKSFMDTIQDHDYVLTVVSDTYLRRQACMYEVGEIIKNRRYKDKLLFVVLSEKERKYYGKDAPEKIKPDIYEGTEKRLEYVEFWKKHYESLKEKMISIDDYEAISKATGELQILGQIYRKDIAEFVEYLADENGKNFEKLYEKDFEEIVAWLR